MKKLLFSLFLINLFVSGVNAQTYTGNCSISLNAQVNPYYSIKIPKTINVQNNETTFEYYICGDIYADQTLKVEFDDGKKVVYDVKDDMNTVFYKNNT